MTDRDFAAGSFEGQVLTRLGTLEVSVNTLAHVLGQKIEAMCERCVTHAERIATLESRVKGHSGGNAVNRWLIGVLFTIFLTILGILGYLIVK